jgi:uncharacterized membrane protein YjfL (UPF0719 family)
MIQRLALGLAVGATVSAVAWNSNQVPHRVSTFPDGLTLVCLVALIHLAVWIHFRRVHPESAADAFKAGCAIAATAGVIFGSAVALLSVVRFGQLIPELAAFGFLTALLSTLAFGAMASAIAWRHQRIHHAALV